MTTAPMTFDMLGVGQNATSSKNKKTRWIEAKENIFDSSVEQEGWYEELGVTCRGVLKLDPQTTPQLLCRIREAIIELMVEVRTCAGHTILA